MTFHESVKEYLRMHPGSSMKDIRQALGMSRRSLYDVMKSLQRQGMIRTTPNLRDTRLTHFYLNQLQETVHA